MVKARIRNLLPYPILAAWRLVRRGATKLLPKSRSPEAIFTRIYANNEWGGTAGEFCSGGGSSEDQIAERYLEKITSHPLSIPLKDCRIVDLGCGDMRIGSQLISQCRSFTGVEVVKPLVERHLTTFTEKHVEFIHLDITRDSLPEGDVCLIRQVLQHLSNQQIALVLPKLRQYRHVFITEHLPSTSAKWRPNLDKPTGRSIRMERGSGIDITEDPFAIPKSEVLHVLDVLGNSFCDDGDRGVIRTILYTPHSSRK